MRIGVVVLAGGALALAVPASHAGAGQATSAPAASVSAPSVVPPALQILEQKMEQLQVRTERFSTRSQGTIEITNESNGKPAGPTRHVSLSGSESGVVSLSPSVSEVSISSSVGRTKEIAIGSTVYVHSPTARKLARLDGGRPWVRSRGATDTILPFHGSSEELSLGGSGPYAGLINILATAVGEVVQAGPVVVDGQQATEFEATVDPLELVRGLTQEDVAHFKRRPPSYHLAVYLTESGVPVRVVTNVKTPSGDNALSSTSTTDVLALEVPVAIEPPPASRTISEARFNELAAKYGKALGVEERTVSSSGSSR